MENAPVDGNDLQTAASAAIAVPDGGVMCRHLCCLISSKVPALRLQTSQTIDCETHAERPDRRCRNPKEDNPKGHAPVCRSPL
eukprot:4626423-Pyramimonas_sp.AAC.1